MKNKIIENKKTKNIAQLDGIFENGYGIIAKKIMLDENLTIEAKAIYSFLCAYSGAGTTSFPSVEYQYGKLGISKNRYYKHRNILINNGYIKIEKRRQVLEYTDKTKHETWENNLYTIVTSNKEIEELKQLNTSTKQTKIKASKVVRTVENTVLAECLHFEDTQNEDTQNEDTNNNSLTNNSLTNNNLIKERKKDKTEFDICIEEFSSNEEVRETIREFIKFRFSIGKKINTRGLKLALNKLSKLSIIDSIQVDIINNSIMAGWSQFFPLKEDKKVNTSSKKTNSKDMKFNNYNQRDYKKDEYEEMYDNNEWA